MSFVSFLYINLVIILALSCTSSFLTLTSNLLSYFLFFSKKAEVKKRLFLFFNFSFSLTLFLFKIKIMKKTKKSVIPFSTDFFFKCWKEYKKWGGEWGEINLKQLLINWIRIRNRKIKSDIFTRQKKLGKN